MIKHMVVPLDGSELAERALPCAERLAAATGAEVVVMCSHGRSGLARFALGSIADRLLHDGMAPLLLVRARTGTPQR